MNRRFVLALLAFLLVMVTAVTLSLGGPPRASDAPVHSVYLPLVTNQGGLPTPTPTPTPTRNPALVRVLPNYSHWEDGIGNLWIFGEVQNDSSNMLWLVRVTINFFNRDGELVGTDFAYVELDRLPPGQRGCFASAWDIVPGWAYYTFQLSHHTSSDRLPRLTLLDVRDEKEWDLGFYYITGAVRNDEATTVRYVMPVGTVYSTEGKVMNCQNTFVEGTHLDPGQTSGFKLQHYIPASRLLFVGTYRVQVRGRLQ